MLGNFLNGNRETSAVSEENESDWSGKEEIRNPDVNAAEESGRPIVPRKAVNEVEASEAEAKGEASGAKAEESLEGRGRTKENANETHAATSQS